MIKKDYQSYNLSMGRAIKGWLTGHSFFAVLQYRISHWLYCHHIPLLPDILRSRTIKRFSCEISPGAILGGGFRIHHTVGIVIGHEVVMGQDCEVFQNVTIGSNRKMKNGRYMPVIGDRVSIGAGAVVVGSITIGNDVLIGANSYVDKDIPSGSVVAGVPARVIKKNTDCRETI